MIGTITAGTLVIASESFPRFARLTLSLTGAAFGNIDVGDSAWAGFSVKNVGNQNLTVSGVALTPGGSGDLRSRFYGTIRQVVRR